jgi:hypothetical protein
MTLRDSITADAAAVFCNTDDFAESVTYVPHRFYGQEARASRTINAVVLREQITVIGEDGDTVSPIWQIHVANSSTLGISSSELDLGGDAITFPPRDGKTDERRQITQLILQDHGMLVLECR